MALAHEDAARSSTGTLTRMGDPRHHGRSPLAEVVPIRPAVAPLEVAVGSFMTRIVQVFASLRAQAAPVDSPPPPPSSPDPRMHTPSPDDAA